MGVFVSLAEFDAYLTIDGVAPSSSDAAARTQLIDDVEAQFASDTGRSLESFTDEAAVVEVYDGTGSPDLYLNYPIAEDGLISVVLGYNAASPDETLAVADPTVLVYGEGSRRITRVDGGVFGRCGARRCVTVEYDHLGDLPADAKLAIKSVASAVYRLRGSEGMKSETVGSFYSYTLDDTKGAASADTHWRIAVASSARGHLV